MLESTENKIVYLVGAEKDYAFPVRFLKKEDVHCFIADGREDKELIYGTDFTILPKENYLNGGTVHLVKDLKIGTKLAIVRLCDPTQDLDLPEHGKLPSVGLETMLDKILMLIQEHLEILKRCVKISMTSGDDPERIIDMILGAKDMSLTAAESAAKSNASCSASVLVMQTIWAELTGDDAGAQAALEAFKQAFEAAGSISAAAEAGIKSVNDASMAAVEYAAKQIEESKDASVEVLAATTKSRKDELLALISEAVGAEGTVAAALKAAEEAAQKALESKEGIDLSIQGLYDSVEAAKSVLDERKQEALAAAKEAEEQAKQAGDSAAEAYSYIAQVLANKNASLQAAQDAAEAAASAELSALAAAGAAGEAAQTAAANSITAHNNNVDSHKNLFDRKLDKAGGTLTGNLYTNGNIYKDINGSTLFLAGGKDLDSGAYIAVRGKDHESHGTLHFVMQDGTNFSCIDLTPDGKFILNGQHIVRKVNGCNADANGNITLTQLGCLPLTGGKMTGTITTTTGDNTAAIAYTDGSKRGGQLWLYDVDDTTYKGGFQLRATDSNGTYWSLRGGNDGILRWNGKEITLGYPNYSAGVSLGSKSSYTVTQDGWLFVGVTGGQGSIYVTCNGGTVMSGGSAAAEARSILFPVKKNDAVKVSTAMGVAFTGQMILYPNR